MMPMRESGHRAHGFASVPVAKMPPPAPALMRTKKGRYKVTRPWTLDIGGQRWTVQKGYTCNGITAPEKIRKSLGDGVQHPETWAAVFHDWLYTQPGMTRDKADRLFRELLLAYNVPAFKADLMFSGVSAYSATKSLR
jgi:hypothetical protein